MGAGEMFFEENPFYILGVHSTDDVETIENVKEDLILEAESKEQIVKYETAAAILKNPSRRLHAEMFWLPGYNKKGAYRIIEGLKRCPKEIREQSAKAWPGIWKIYALWFMEAKDRRVYNFVWLSSVFGIIQIKDIVGSINYDRRQAHFVEISDIQSVRLIWNEIPHFMINGISVILKKEGWKKYSEFVTAVINAEKSEDSGYLVSCLVENYRSFMLKKSEESLDAIWDILRPFMKYHKISDSDYVCSLIMNYFQANKPIFKYNAKNIGRIESDVLFLVRQLCSYERYIGEQKGDLVGANKIANTMYGEIGDVADLLEILQQNLIIYRPDHPQISEQSNFPQNFYENVNIYSNNNEHKINFNRAKSEVKLSEDVVVKEKSDKERLHVKFKWLIRNIFKAFSCAAILFLGICFVGTIMNNASTDVPNNQTTRKTEKIEPVQTVGNDMLSNFKEPIIGAGTLHDMSEIRWGIREEIRLDTLRNMDLNEAGINAYNEMVENYNNRAGSFRYQRGNLERARQQVEAMRPEIEEEIKNRAIENEWVN